MSKRKTVYFSELLRRDHPNIYHCLKAILNKHHYEVKTLKETNDIWIRDFMPIAIKDKLIQYQYKPDYLNNPTDIKYRTNPDDPIMELGLNTVKTDLVLDGGNALVWDDTVIVTDKLWQDNKPMDTRILLPKLVAFKFIKTIPRDPDPEEVYGHADGMVRYISKKHLLVNSQYDDLFKKQLHLCLEELYKFKITELKVKENTKYAWGYINFLHLDNLIIQPSIDKINDEYVKSQLEELYPNTSVELCDAKALLEKGGGFNCVSWEFSSDIVLKSCM